MTDDRLQITEDRFFLDYLGVFIFVFWFAFRGAGEVQNKSFDEIRSTFLETK